MAKGDITGGYKKDDLTIVHMIDNGTRVLKIGFACD